MLVLTRRSSQSIVIGKDIVVTVLEVRGDQVRIGVSAPRDVDVHREEVFLELQETNRSAASPSAEAVEALGQLLPPATGRSGAASAGPSGGVGLVQKDYSHRSVHAQARRIGPGRGPARSYYVAGAGRLPKSCVSRRHRAGAAAGSAS